MMNCSKILVLIIFITISFTTLISCGVNKVTRFTQNDTNNTKIKQTRNREDSVKMANYQSEALKFSVEYPAKWSYKGDNGIQSTSEQEASPDAGIYIHIDGNQDEVVYIFRQSGHISIPESGFDKEDFTTNSGVKGYLLSNDDGKTKETYLVLGEGFYGAHIKVSLQCYKSNEKTILNVLKSIELLD